MVISIYSLSVGLIVLQKYQDNYWTLCTAIMSLAHKSFYAPLMLWKQGINIMFDIQRSQHDISFNSHI